MRKYLLRYLIFWLPAVLVACFYNRDTTTSQVLQWFFAFFMLFGWTVNTGMASYHFPRSTLSVLLTYTGLSLLNIVTMYNAVSGTGVAKVTRRFGGLLNFRPLDIMVQSLKDFLIPHELYVTGFLIVCCLGGYIAGLIHRRVRPNPYRPRVYHE